ncbi:MAG: hypothetical protein AAB339_09365 [Elusimicrobiota bacterium]
MSGTVHRLRLNFVGALRRAKSLVLLVPLLVFSVSTGAYAQAASVMERFVEKFPEDSKGTDELAGIYLSMGERRKAIALLKGYFKGPQAAAERPPVPPKK